MPDSRFSLPAAPVANPSACVRGDRWRISVLTPCLVRLEYAPAGAFEDRATQTVLNRAFAVPDFEVRDRQSRIEVVTEGFHLGYDKRPFTSNGLSIQVRGNVSKYHSVWRYGIEGPTLGGTARTLDDINGSIPLEPGLMNKTGYSLLDDSGTLALTDGGWVAPRPAENLDLYVFTHGRDYHGVLRDFYALTGPAPMLPRYALGNWWSRYHAYTAEEYTALIERFEAERLPFSVAVLDMDWHRVDIDPRHGSGWTGYSWNTDLFPDPPAFLDRVHRHGLRVCLNDHPADGIRAHEDRYPDAARAYGIDPASEQPIAFDIADPHFAEVYFDQVLHPLEDEGVDFWWLDWQSGPFSAMPGLDPLWMLNHTHYLDNARDGRRPLAFSRYAGPGSHRYPIGFSGDTVITWESLDFQPFFTATAANIGYGWWSHDIGGHMFGYRDDELATRWIQFGTFSPINRLHSTSNGYTNKEPWLFPPAAEQVMSEFLRLRHRLIPYLYAMNERAHRLGEPLALPLYYTDPWREDAYAHPNAFTFGTELLVSPITQPGDPKLLVGSSTAWLPEGLWFDMFTAVAYEGGRSVRLHRPLDSIPVLARAGAIIPLTGLGELRVENPGSFEVVVYAGADGYFEIYEDDDALNPRTLRTPLRWDWESGRFTIEPAIGDLDVGPRVRDWTITLVGSTTERATVEMLGVDAAQGCEIDFGAGLEVAPTRIERPIRDFLMLAQIEFDTKWRIEKVLSDQRLDNAGRLRGLHALELDPGLFGVLAEWLLAR